MVGDVGGNWLHGGLCFRKFETCEEENDVSEGKVQVFGVGFTQFKHFVGLGRRGVRRMKGGGLYIVRKKENFIGFFVMRICWHWRGWEESEWSQKEK